MSQLNKGSIVAESCKNYEEILKIILVISNFLMQDNLSLFS